MPLKPILYRESFYEEKVDKDSGLVEMWDLDWNLVNTLKGAMIEPRQLNPIGFGNTGKMRAMDEQSVNKRSKMSFEEFARTFQTWGRQLPVDSGRY